MNRRSGETRTLRYRRRSALPAAAAVFTCGVLALNLLAVMADRGPFASRLPHGPMPWVLWVLLTLVCVRLASRRVVLRPGGAVLVGVLSNRRVRWADVAEVELTRRTVRSSSSERWRVVLRMRDSGIEWVPGFLHGSVSGGPDRKLGETRVLDQDRYPIGYTEPPPDAPAELAGLHRELRSVWLRAGGRPLSYEERVRKADERRRGDRDAARTAALEKLTAELADQIARIESQAGALGIELPKQPPAAPGADGMTALERFEAQRRYLDDIRRHIKNAHRN